MVMHYDQAKSEYLKTDEAYEVLKRTKEKWHLDRKYPLPKSRWMKCNFCRSHDLIIRQMSFHKRKNATHPYRCDVFFKCCECGVTPTCGVAIPEEMFRQHDDHQNRHIRRHEILKDLDGEEIEPWEKTE